MVASELASVVLEGTYWMLLSGGLPLTTISTSFFNIFLHIIFFFVFLYSFYGSFFFSYPVMRLTSLDDTLNDKSQDDD